MTPKEKAKELFNKMLEWSEDRFEYNGMQSKSVSAKECALIAVDEILDEYAFKICNSGYDNDWEMWDKQREYWQEVKQEIEKL